MKLLKAVAKRLKEIMKERNITQYNFSKITGIPQSTLSTIFNSDRNDIRLSTIYEVCSGLGIEFSEFFEKEYLKIESIED